MLNFSQSYVKRVKETKAGRRKSSVTILAVLFTLLSVVVALATGCEPEVTRTVAPAAPADTAVRLVFTQQSEEAIAGSVFTNQPVVTVEDAKGNPVTSYKGLVVLTITANTGAPDARLFGGTKLALANGTARFRELFIDKAAVGYTLTATCGSLVPAISKPFTVLPGAPSKLAFTIQPSGGTAGSPLTPSPEVIVQDRYGNKVTDYKDTVTLAFVYSQTPGAAALSGTTTVPVINGVARFTDVSINISYPEYKLEAVSAYLESATSRRFEILDAAPVKLEFTVQPFGAKAGTPFENQPKVGVMDSYGNVVTDSRASITLTITTGTGADGSILSGTKTLVAEGGLGGLAEFTDLAIDQAGSAYTLTATSDGLASATSQAFDVESP